MCWMNLSVCVCVCVCVCVWDSWAAMVQECTDPHFLPVWLCVCVCVHALLFPTCSSRGRRWSRELQHNTHTHKTRWLYRHTHTHTHTHTDTHTDRWRWSGSRICCPTIILFLSLVFQLSSVPGGHLSLCSGSSDPRWPRLKRGHVVLVLALWLLSDKYK